MIWWSVIRIYVSSVFEPPLYSDDLVVRHSYLTLCFFFQFEIDEVDLNKCSVPHCIISRYQLSRWRLAAIDLFKFPDNLPMTLYICPEAERDQWVSGEIDFYSGDPNTRHSDTETIWLTDYNWDMIPTI